MEELSKPENRAKIKGKMYCNEHSGKALKIYCETCDQLICKHCMDFKHVKQNHLCLLVKDVASHRKQLLASKNKEMEVALTEGNLYLQRLSHTTVQLDSNAEDAENEIVQRRDAMTKKVVAMLNQKAETLLNKVRQIHRVKREKLDKQTKETTRYVENIKQSVQLSKKLVAQGTEEEMISSQKMMLENANYLLAKGLKYFKAAIPAVKVKYTSSASKETLNKDILGAMANSLGEVNDDDQAGNQSGKSNPKSAGTFTSKGHYSSMPPSNSNVVAPGNTTKGKENIKHSVQRVKKRLVEEEIFSSLDMVLKEKEALENSLRKVNNAHQTENKKKTSSPNATTPYSSPASRNASSSLPTSYSGPVRGKKEKGKDANLGPHQKTADDEKCQICLSSFTEKKTLDKCGHSFCAGCICQAFKYQKKCPLCFQDYGTLTGNQPDGKMIESYQSTSLPGFKSCGTIVMTYIFESGIQGPNHPNPGQRYRETRRIAYLPDNAEGRKVLALLKKAFDQKLTFTIGRSLTTGENNVITWNDIHHKTSSTGGSSNFGYPDPDYLKRVQEELAAKGITE